MPDEEPPPPPRKWVPITIVTSAVVGLSIPLGLLTFRRLYRSRTLSKAPPRRTANNVMVLSQAMATEALPAAPVVKQSINIRALVKDIIWPNPTPVARPPWEAVLRMTAAFGLATFAVGVTSLVSIWGTMALLSVNNVEEFSFKMRSFLAATLPSLTSRIHNLHTYSEEETDEPPDWNWESAKQRLQEVYDKEGLLAWSEAALEETEKEARLERFKRRHA